MKDEYAYLRGQYESIVQHCEYLLRNSVDAAIRARALDSKKKATAELARLDRQLACVAGC